MERLDVFRLGLNCKYVSQIAGIQIIREANTQSQDSDGGRLSYRMAKAALNQQTASLSADFRAQGMKSPWWQCILGACPHE